MLTRIFVLERTAHHAIDVAFGGQGNRPGDRGTGALSRLDDLRGRLVELLVVIALEANSDLVLWQAYGSWLMGEISERLIAPSTSPAFNSSCHPYSMISVTAPAPTVRPPSRIAKRRP